MAFFLHVSPDMTAGDLVVGCGTLALAAFTAWLAWRTSAEVKVSEEQMRLSRESVEAQDRPFVIPTGRAPRGVLMEGAFVAKLENLGRGPAMVEAIQITSQGGHEYLDDPFQGRIRPISAGDYLSLSLTFNGGGPDENTTLTIRTSYRSVSGGRYLTISVGKVLAEKVIAFSDHRRLELD
jgi:hypothetical protein